MKKKFDPAKRHAMFSEIADEQWNDSNWQLAEAKLLPSHGNVTPYYLGLIDAINPDCPMGRLANSGIFNVPDNLENQIEEMVGQSDRIVLDTNLPALLPMYFSDKLISGLKAFDQVFFHMHFNHPRECSREAYEACGRLANAGFILNNKMTLLHGINDDASVVTELNHRLLMMRVRPYSIFNENVSHLKGSLQVPESRGVEIIESLRGWTSGLAVPHYVVRNEAGDKMVIPNYVKSLDDGVYTFRNYKNNEYRYQDS